MLNKLGDITTPLQKLVLCSHESRPSMQLDHFPHQWGHLAFQINTFPFPSVLATTHQNKNSERTINHLYYQCSTSHICVCCYLRAWCNLRASALQDDGKQLPYSPVCQMHPALRLSGSRQCHSLCSKVQLLASSSAADTALVTNRSESLGSHTFEFSWVSTSERVQDNTSPSSVSVSAIQLDIPASGCREDAPPPCISGVSEDPPP